MIKFLCGEEHPPRERRMVLKKILFLSLIVMAGLLAACGKKKEAQADVTSVPAVTDTPAPTYTPTNTPTPTPTQHVHEFVLEVVSPPGCLYDGVAEGVCACGERNSEFTVIPATGHHMVETREREPDCNHTGKISYHCDVCGMELGTERIPALGHDWGGPYAETWVIERYSSEGLCGIMSHTCIRCGYKDYLYPPTLLPPEDEGDDAEPKTDESQGDAQD